MDTMKIIKRLFGSGYQLLQPYVDGLEHVDLKKPALYVGNHTMMGVMDVPFLYIALHEAAEINMKALAHKALYYLPVLSSVAKEMGIYKGTRENCEMLMQNGEHIIVFPGGGREVCKRKGEKYKLIWKNRLGFVRMAIANGYPIIPFASVGAEDCFEIKYDANDFLNTKVGKVLQKLLPSVGDITMPIVKGWAGTPLPKPQRFYYKLMKPIETAHLKGKEDDDKICLAVRDLVKSAVEAGIEDLLRIQKDDPKRNPLTYLWLGKSG